MPNPFIRGGPANQSSTQGLADSDNHPVGIAPIPENASGMVFAYRGTETHGVEAPTDSQLPPGYDQDVETVVEIPEPDIEPVPVRIVTERSDSQRRFRIIRGITNASTIPVQALGPMHNRSTCKVFNVGAVTLYIGADPQMSSVAFGYPILQNTSESFDDCEDSSLYIVSADGTAQPYAIKVEYETET